MGDHIIGGDRISSTNPLSVSVAAGGGGAATIADGADVTQGALADAVVAAGAAGSLSAKLRAISRDLVANIVLAAGSAIIGKVGIDQTTPGTTDRVTAGAGASKVSVTPTLTVHATYATGDYVGTSGVAMVFAAVARVNAGTFVVSKVLVIDKGANANAGELWLFDTAITPPADSAAWSISDADAAHVIDVIPISSFYSSALNSVGIGGSTRLCKAAAADSAIYGCYVIRGAPTADYADGDLTFVLVSAQD